LRNHKKRNNDQKKAFTVIHDRIIYRKILNKVLKLFIATKIIKIVQNIIY